MSHADDLAALAECERRLYEGLTRSDADILEAIMADDIVYIHSQGIAETRAENLIGQRSGLFVHGPVERRTGETRVHGDLAVTFGCLEMIDLGRGEPRTLHLLQTLVWAKAGDTWRLILRQATRVPE